MASLIEEQRKAILGAIKQIQSNNTWRCVVLDETSRKLILNVLKMDMILDEMIVDIADIEERRAVASKEAIYILTPEEHIVRCFISDYDRQNPRYRGAHLLWTTELDEKYRRMIVNSPARTFIRSERILNADFVPRESHLFTVGGPDAFQYIYNPDCRAMVTDYLKKMALKISNVCITLQENPIIRYYRPQNHVHEARVLSEYLAKEVQDELDAHREMNPNFPPQSPRPRAMLFIVDRCMDIYAPLLHEFTYQAMAHDLLPLYENKDMKIVYEGRIENREGDGEENKEMALKEEDNVWVANRHRHMKDTIDKLSADFEQFLKNNKNFVNSQAATSVHAIKDMMASLPQFQEEKEIYSLHLSMAQECMSIFAKRKLMDVGLAEQTLATGYNENNQMPKNILDTVVRLLDDDALGNGDRLRLIILYILFRDGVIEDDIQKLVFHSQLKRQDEVIIKNLDLLGARPVKALKEPPRPGMVKKKPPPPDPNADESYDLSRFVTAVKTMLEDYIKSNLDPTVYPFTKPDMALSANRPDSNVAPTSLRTAKPTWARRGNATTEPRQRIIVFVAGGATYSEARACYEISQAHNRDVYLGTTHMLTPGIFLDNLANVRQQRRTLRLPEDAPKKEVPRHLLEPDPIPKPQPRPQATPSPAPPRPAQAPPPAEPPTQQMANMKVGKEVPYYLEDQKEKKKKKKFWR